MIQNKTCDSYWGYQSIARDWTDISNDGTYKCCNNIALGAGDNDRHGSYYKMSSLSFRGALFPTYTDPVLFSKGSNLVRIVALVNHQNAGSSALDPDDVIDLYNTHTGSGVWRIYGMRNIETMGKYSVLHDEVFEMGPFHATQVDGTDTGYYRDMKYVNFTVPLNGLLVQCSDDGAFLTDIVTNSVHIIACAYTGGQITLQGMSRIRFTSAI